MFVFFIRKKHTVYGLVFLIILITLFLLLGHFAKSEDAPAVSPIYIGNTKEKAISLMVNVDWGEDILPGMLKVFKDKNIKATFFITGRFAEKFPETVKKIAADGHEIANHGYSHPHADKISSDENAREITVTEKVFTELGLNSSKLYAPPYGEHKAHVLAAADALGYKTIMWTVDTIDWQEPKAEIIVKRVLDKADNGSLVLMHPKKCTLEALPQLVDSLFQHNFAFKTVSEILQ